MITAERNFSIDSSVLRSDLVTSQLLDCVFCDIAKGNHANRLPDSESNAGSDATVQALDAVALVDVAESLADSQVLGSLGILSLALHLNTNDLNRLVPSTQTTTNSTSQNLLSCAQFCALVFACDRSNSILGKTGQTEPRAPVGGLADGNSVDTLVDTPNTLLAVDVRECCKCGRRLDATGSQLMLGDLDRLHAGTETHGSVCLSDTTSHTTDNTTTELRGTE